MFNNKLAQSIQRDYRQAADNHRLVKATGSKSNRLPLLQLISATSVFIAAFSLFIFI
jgi:hypothetical protein